MIEIPFDTVAAVATPNWREHAAWPQPVMASYRRGRDRIGTLLRAVSAIENDESRQIAILASCRMLVTALPLLELAYALDTQDERGMRIVGNDPLLSYLRGDGIRPEEAVNKFAPSEPNGGIVPPLLRHVARTASWTPWRRLPATLLAPQVTALSHNTLLVDAACLDSQRIDFRRGGLIFNKAVSLHQARTIEHRDALLVPMLEALGPGEDLGEAYRDRWWRLARQIFLGVLEKAERDVKAVKDMDKLPEIAWLGGGGNWGNRALAAEIRRRGGRVSCFDHGHNRSLHDVHEWAALLEMLVADRFVAPTKALADRYAASPIRELLPPGEAPIFDSFGVATDLSPHIAPTRRRHGGGRPKVVYAPGIMRGFHTTIPAPLPDILYFDLQMRVAELLDALPVDVVCRPHPQGRLSGRRHPLEDIFPIANESFEQLAKTADLFLFDDPNSRVLCQAMVTDRAMVYLDIGVPYFHQSILPMVAKRCTILRLAEDERGRAIIDSEAFEDAIRNPKKPDPEVLTALRRVMVADEV